MLTELIQIAWYTMAATGVLAWLALPVLVYCLVAVGKDIGDMAANDPYGEQSLLQLDDRSQPRSRALADIQCQPVDRLLDNCIEPRARLQYYYRTLCERCGIDHTGMTLDNDLIAEAVFDGRNVNKAIEFINERIQESQEQHA